MSNTYKSYAPKKVSGLRKSSVEMEESKQNKYAKKYAYDDEETDDEDFFFWGDSSKNQVTEE